jgi:nitrate reductase gamma subunit
MKVDYLFRVWPYVALGVLAIGLFGRSLLPSRGEGPAEPGVSPGWRRVALGALAAVALAHAAAILCPGAVIAWDGSVLRLYFLEAVGLAMGLSTFVACVAFARRRLAVSRSLGTTLADASFFALLLLGAASGIAMACAYRWGSLWGAAVLTPYLASVARGSPRTELVAQLPFLVRLHVFTAFAAVAVLPFTSMVGAALAASRRALAGRQRSPAGLVGAVSSPGDET